MDDFKLMLILAIVVLPLLLLARPPRKAASPARPAAAE
jgi:hypothetical protein